MGMIMENVVGADVKMRKPQVIFLYQFRPEDKNNRMEIDFLIAKNSITNKHNISPIEVKSGSNYTLNSLKKFRNKFPNQLDKSYILHTSDLKEENGFIYLPLYMTSLL